MKTWRLNTALRGKTGCTYTIHVMEQGGRTAHTHTYTPVHAAMSEMTHSRR